MRLSVHEADEKSSTIFGCWLFVYSWPQCLIELRVFVSIRMIVDTSVLCINLLFFRGFPSYDFQHVFFCVISFVFCWLHHSLLRTYFSAFQSLASRGHKQWFVLLLFHRRLHSTNSKKMETREMGHNYSDNRESWRFDISAEKQPKKVLRQTKRHMDDVCQVFGYIHEKNTSEWNKRENQGAQRRT